MSGCQIHEGHPCPACAAGGYEVVSPVTVINFGRTAGLIQSDGFRIRGLTYFLATAFGRKFSSAQISVVRRGPGSVMLKAIRRPSGCSLPTTTSLASVPS